MCALKLIIPRWNIKINTIFKKTTKKAKKSVDKGGERWYTNWAAQGAGGDTGERARACAKKSLKTFEKGIDKSEWMRYNNKVARQKQGGVGHWKLNNKTRDETQRVIRNYYVWENSKIPEENTNQAK